MQRKSLHLFFVLLLSLMGGVSSVFAQSDKSTDYTGNVTLSTTGGTSASACAVVIGTDNYNGIKAGTSSVAGAVRITVPSGTKYLHLHVAGWNGETVTLGVSPTTGVSPTSISLTANTGIKNSTPFTFNGTPSSSNYYKVITFSTALASNTNYTFTASSGKRFVIWGVTAEEESTDEATTVTIDASGITNTDVASGTAAGSFSAIVKDASSNTIGGASVTWSSSNEAVATVNSTTGAVTLVKKGSTTITATYAGVVGTYQASNNTYVLNVTNSNAGDGTSAHPFTPTEARDALDAGEIDAETEYYVKGIIARIGTYSSGALTYFISNDGTMTKNIQCYRGKNVSGANFTGTTDLEVGDIATVKGKLKIYGGTTYELDENNEVVSITTRTKVNIATFTATTNPLVLGGTETTATSVTNDQVGWTPASYTYESDDESVATVNASGVVTAVAKGTANITVKPVVSYADPTYKEGSSKSIKITVCNPSHTASFSVNGVINPADNDVVEEGDAITFPADPASILGKEFQGWTTSPIDGLQANAPATLVTSATMSTANITYYAVFASEAIGEKNMTITINTSTDNFPDEYGTANTFTEYTLEGKKFKIQQAYVNGTKLQWRAAGNSSGTGTMYNTEALNKIQSVVLTYDSSDNYKNFTLKVGDAENPSSGTSITPTSSGLVYTFDCSSYNKSYFVLTNGSNAGYLSSIAITYKGTGTITTDYCTTVPSVSIEISAAGWATYCSSNALDFTNVTGLTAYTATKSGSSVIFNKVEGKVPAGEGLLVKGTTTNVPVCASASAVTNILVGVTSNTNKDANTIFVLKKGANGIGFYKNSNAFTVRANSAYLNAADVAGARTFIALEDDETTGIENLTPALSKGEGAIYDLQGRRITTPAKGLYIVNGKKIVVK